MRKINTILLAGMMLVLGAGVAMADTFFSTHQIDIVVQPVLLVALNDPSTISLTLGQPLGDVAGAEPDYTAEDFTSKRLFYTVVSTDTIEITVDLDATSEDIPSGLTLAIQGVPNAAKPAEGTGATASLELSGGTLNGAGPVVSGISNCWTGITGTDGAQLKYTLTSDGSAVNGSAAVVLKYTIAATP